MNNRELARAQSVVRREARKRAAAIMKRVGSGESIAEIARSLNISRQRASQIVQRERKKVECKA